LRRWWVLGLLMVLMIAVSPAMAQKMVSISTVTADLSYTKDYGAISEGNNLTITLNLPFTLESLNNTNSNITIVANSSTDSTTINLTVNGVAVATNYDITGGSSATWTFPDFASAGVDMSATTLTIVIEAVANNTASETLNLTCDDGEVVANFSYTVTEVKLSKPEVKFYDVDSFYSVKQTVNITQNSDVNISDVKCTFSYPENAINKPVTSYNFGTLNTSEHKTYDILFQKRGPYVGEIKNIENDGNYTTVIRIYSPENLTVDMTIKPSEKPWSKYFPEFSEENIISVTLNGVKVEYTKGSIILKGISLNEGWNELNITYSKPVVAGAWAPVSVAVTPWYEGQYLGVPMWLWAIAVGFFAIALIVYCHSRR